jgi:two-component system chemotaxis sensor kinase CheA
MSIVKNTVQELGGVLTVDTTAGQGTCFVLELPLTLSIVDALIVRVADSIFAIPLPAVREVMQVASAEVRQFENNEIISYRGAALPIIRLARLFELEEGFQPSLHVMVIGSGSTSVGIAVDRIVAQREIVVHALTDPLVHVPGISGATELGDGRVVLIVDAAGLARLAQKPERRSRKMV